MTHAASSIPTDAAPAGDAPSVPRHEASRLDMARRPRENFHVLSRLVPKDRRADFASVYAFCRVADDLADEGGADDDSRRNALRRLADFRALLDDAIRLADARPVDASRREIIESHPVFAGLAHAIRRRALPTRCFHDLLDAFEQDQRVDRYETWEQALDYCTRSANPVGRLVLALLDADTEGPHAPVLLDRADALCSALQLANFWQDVRSDLIERDRVYLPHAECGLTADDLREMAARGDRRDRRRFAEALEPLVRRTAELFDHAEPMLRALPPRHRPVIWLFLAGGRRVLRRIEGVRYATLWERPRLSRRERATLLARAWGRRALDRRRPASP